MKNKDKGKQQRTNQGKKNLSLLDVSCFFEVQILILSKPSRCF